MTLHCNFTKKFRTLDPQSPAAHSLGLKKVFSEPFLKDTNIVPMNRCFVRLHIYWTMVVESSFQRDFFSL